jgi:hypothetical protein
MLCNLNLGDGPLLFSVMVLGTNASVVETVIKPDHRDRSLQSMMFRSRYLEAESKEKHGVWAPMPELTITST